jgi:hypothetical protein
LSSKPQLKLKPSWANYVFKDRRHPHISHEAHFVKENAPNSAALTGLILRNIILRLRQRWANYSSTARNSNTPTHLAPATDLDSAIATSTTIRLDFYFIDCIIDFCALIYHLELQFVKGIYLARTTCKLNIFVERTFSVQRVCWEIDSRSRIA